MVKESPKNSGIQNRWEPIWNEESKLAPESFKIEIGIIQIQPMPPSK